MALIKEILKDKVSVKIFDTRTAMGEAAGRAASEKIKELLKVKDEVNMIFAAAPSQNETLEVLTKDEEIDWTRVNAFHMDEYIGLSADAPQGFGNFLKDRIFAHLPFKSVNYIYSESETADLFALQQADKGKSN